ncbi:CGNR zinc finger domain-containing protein [Flexivirga oryzae]|uniref:Putative RNA-binding Zn ribbon-like protein n=1 Tax=Flexivirga oryzae TaxID=1794944 RepID=A0A839NEK5_9MICO|nr:putative RNA-binding Zn ribbon-like protein [Flexivirga oryzae]
MVFAHDTEVALTGAAALVNTAVEDPDPLLDEASYLDFVRGWEWSGPVVGSAAEREAVRAIRPEIRALWTDDEPALVARVNDLLRRESALPQLVKHGDWDWHLHATPPDAPLASRWIVEVAMAMVDVVRAGELRRLRTCAADDCDGVLVDLSRNRSKRYCDLGCGNRLAVAAYRARLTSDSGDDLER